MLAPHWQFGKEAEERALSYFLETRPGARLLERNFHSRGGEVDLIFEEPSSRSGVLVFVEVRARAAGGILQGLETLDPRKRRRLARVIRYYLASRYRGGAREMRVDVLSWDGHTWTHLKNAWI